MAGEVARLAAFGGSNQGHQPGLFDLQIAPFRHPCSTKGQEQGVGDRAQQFVVKGQDLVKPPVEPFQPVYVACLHDYRLEDHYRNLGAGAKARAHIIRGPGWQHQMVAGRKFSQGAAAQPVRLAQGPDQIIQREAARFGPQLAGRMEEANGGVGHGALSFRASLVEGLGGIGLGVPFGLVQPSLSPPGALRLYPPA